jgi:hypothetical protein
MFDELLNWRIKELVNFYKTKIENISFLWWFSANFKISGFQGGILIFGVIV